MTDPNDFFRKQFIWDIAPRPERSITTATPTTTRGSDGGRNTTLAAGNTPIDPLYLTMQLPESSQQEFVLMRPFVPRGKANQLSAFLAARMDGENYGKLVSYEIPTTLVAPSPAQAGTLVESDPDISSTLSLIDQRGSAVLRGNVQLIPVGQSIIYARPIYVEGQGEGQFPRLRFVALAYGNSAVLVDFAAGEGQINTVDQGIRLLLGAAGCDRTARQREQQRVDDHHDGTERDHDDHPERDDHDTPAQRQRPAAVAAGGERARGRRPGAGRERSRRLPEPRPAGQGVRGPGEPDPGRRLTTGAPPPRWFRAGAGLFGPEGIVTIYVV